MKPYRYYLLPASITVWTLTVWICLCAEDNIFLDNLELPEYNAPLTITRQSTPCHILELLYSQTHLNRILKNDLYTYTYPIGLRNILTYPSLYTFTPDNSQVNWSIFYQEMPTVFPFANGIGGYINLFTADYLRDVDIEIAREYNINIPKTISLLQNARVEQRRVGFMFDLWKRIKCLSIGVQFPFYAVARNYNLPLEDQQELRTTLPPLIQQFSTSTSDSLPMSESAIHPYVLETRLGLGDTRLSFGFHIIEKERAQLVLGTKITLPTEATLASGFIGSDFSKCLTRKYLDLETFTEQVTEDVTKNQALATAKQFGMAAVYQLNETLLGTQLGDFNRTQIALYAQPTVHASNQVSLTANFCANWLLTKNVRRFIKPTVDQADFADANFDSDLFPPAECNQMSTAALTFLSNRLENVLMPPQYTVRLKSQLEVQVTAQAQIQFTDSWNFVIGYDYWRRHAECTKFITSCHESVSFANLQVPTALIPQMSQQKILLKAEYTKFKVSHNFTFAFGTDLPISSKNIGDDYTGFVKFVWNF